ncbi:ester cyclase [Pseudomonas aeruginosa]|uniref:ester cyclase n=1 Tax=Pseudomonas aeruginosa TaxID=287 RepID=UPI00053EB13A|nr:ester cyclase [Pseudomonas aeruginosa]MCO2030129.1 ester cyclase [Pseudomonas aeruginosa]MCS7675719.1 ester cyclase [Pseudomonas aeruginosa]MCS7905026.1 ester cyclase [Pseudomonas aeruginosa]MCS9345789.1 ester cyclase [Pseudomonas aeruginosa]MCS9358628.1 ester cyclase [Pseudomonas aeruginosa]
MSTLTETAMSFFEVCESGKGWQECRRYCHENAAFNVQAQSLEHLKSVETYSESIPHLMEILPDAHFELINVATDECRQTVIAYARFFGTHTGISEPIPATGKSLSSDYVFIMKMKDGKVAEVTKVWNDGHAAVQLGWA